MSKTQITAAVLLTCLLSLGVGKSAQAGLINRGNGLIYDTVLNVTWLQDVMLGHTLGGFGIFNWHDAMTWADQLVYRGYDDWRLPTLTPINGTSWRLNFRCDGSSDYGYSIAAPGSASAGFTGNELAYMYHVNLGNESACTGAAFTPNAVPPNENATFIDALTGEQDSFLNLQGVARNFWTDSPDESTLSKFLFTAFGLNDPNGTYFRGSAWAVRDGDVSPTAIPEPSTLLLLAALLPGLWFSRKRKNRQHRFA